MPSQRAAGLKIFNNSGEYRVHWFRALHQFSRIMQARVETGTKLLYVLLKHSRRTSSSPASFSAPCPQASTLNIPAIYSVSIPSLWPITAIGCKAHSQRKVLCKHSFSLPSQAWRGRTEERRKKRWNGASPNRMVMTWMVVVVLQMQARERGRSYQRGAAIDMKIKNILICRSPITYLVFLSWSGYIK